MQNSTEIKSFVIERQSPGFDFEPELERNHKHTFKELLKHTFYLIHAYFFHQFFDFFIDFFMDFFS